MRPRHDAPARHGAVILLLGLSGACSGGALDIGSDGVNEPATGGASGMAPLPPVGDPLPVWSEIRTCPEPTGNPFEGTWEGALEDFLFDPIVPVRLVVESASRSSVCGRLTWGTDTEPPPPATDAESAYVDEPTMQLDFGTNEAWPVEGATYAVRNGVARDATLRFGLALPEVWQSWCELQTPFYDELGEEWGCLPRANGSYTNTTTRECRIGTASGELVTTITRCAACSSDFCVCNGTGCTANAEPTVALDFTLSEGGSGQSVTADPGELYSGDENQIRLLRVE
jgi:hypothetical protein